jgi:hypothetical protein
MLINRRITCCLLFLVLPACADAPMVPEQCAAARVPVEVDPAGQRYQYVVDSLDLPENRDEVVALAFDIDGDPQHRVDNALGGIVSLMVQAGADYDFDAEAKQLIDAGEILHLIEVQTADLASAEGVGVFIAHGVDTDGDLSDNFSGQEAFARDPRRGEGYLSGQIFRERLVVELGTAPVAVTFPGLDEPFVLELQQARLEGSISETGLSGVIGGAITAEDVDTKLIPMFQEGLMRIVARDCSTGACAADSFGDELLWLFDADADGVITTDEIRQSSLSSSLLAPDVDLIDQYGREIPGCDGVKDGLSVGLGFHAVRAAFP